MCSVECGQLPGAVRAANFSTMNALISTPADCEGARRDSDFAGGERQTL